MYAKQEEILTDEYESLMELAKARIADKEYNDALSHLARAVSVEIARPEAYNLIGAIFEMNGDIFEAQKYYRAALSFVPSYIPSQKNLARTVKWRGDGDIVLEEMNCCEARSRADLS
ncbi:MAG: hypothetical protein WCX65_07500 [bacterium]